MSRIYLDHAATTPLRPAAAEAMRVGFQLWANPSSPHAEGRRARAALEGAREQIKSAFKWDGEVIFTSGASEAAAIAMERGVGGERLVSAVEHDAVLRAAPGATFLPMGENCTLDMDVLARELAACDNPLVAVQHVNSETGVIQPVSNIAEVVRNAGGLLISDCSQSAGKFYLPDADMIIVSAHKLGGPIGIGALLVRDFAMLAPSGGQERGYRPGTENLPGVLGFAAAVEHRGISPVTIGQGFNTKAVEGWAQWMVGPTLAFVDNEYFIHRHEGIFQPLMAEHRDETIVALTMPGVSAAVQLIQFDAAGFAVSAGSACSSGTLKPSRTLCAFGIPEQEARNTIRVSVGWNTTFEDVIAFIRAWENIAGGKRAA